MFFLFGYVLRFKIIRCAKILFSFYCTNYFVIALAKLKSEYELRYDCLSVSPFVSLSVHMELLGPKWTDFQEIS